MLQRWYSTKKIVVPTRTGFIPQGQTAPISNYTNNNTKPNYTHNKRDDNNNYKKYSKNAPPSTQKQYNNNNNNNSNTNRDKEPR